MAPARPVRDIGCDDSFREAASKIIWTRFDEMLSFKDAALAGRDVEGVHDMRVASRRLRAALELFRDVFSTKRLKPMLREVKGLADALGRVRDLDVQLARLEADQAGRTRAQRDALKEMIDDLREDRDTARQRLRQTLDELEASEFPRRFITFVARETG